MERDLTDGVREARRWFYHFRRRIRVAWLALGHPVVEVAGVRLRVGRHVSPTVRHCLLNGDYENEELATVAAALQPDDVVLELGTGLGLIATFCAKRVGSDRVFTYEANPALEPHIRRTFALNGVSPSLSIALLGESTGNRTFYVTRNFWASSVIRPAGRAKAVTVPVKVLDDELRRIDPTFLVTDIEGGELELFEGMNFRNIRKICLEVHEGAIGPAGVGHVRSLLLDAGFAPDPARSTARVWFLERSKAMTSGESR